MATRKSSIGASLTIDRRQFKAALDASRADATRFASSLSAIKAPRSGVLAGEGLGGFRQQLGGVVSKYQHLRQAVTDVGAVAVRLAGAPAMYNDMSDALTAVTGSADEARQALAFIAGVANEQKLEFEPLVAAYEHMRALGYSAEQTTQFIREMGNAIEASSGSADDLTAAVGALSKIGDKGNISAMALHSMAEEMPFLRKIFKDVFGAETAADIKKLDLTQQELYDGIVRGLKRVETAQGGTLDAASPEYLASMARLRSGRAAAGEGALVPELAPRTVAAPDTEGDANRLKLYRQRVIDAEAAKGKAKQAAAEASGRAELQAATAVADKELEIEKARARGDATRLASLEQELRMMTEGAEIMAKTGLSAEEVADHLQRRADAEKEIASLQKATPDFQKTSAQDLEVARLRARGKNKQADKLEADRAEQERVKQLMTADPNLSEGEAKKMAGQERQYKEDADYLARTGRRKMRGATNAGQFEGIDGYARVGDQALNKEWNFDRLDQMRRDRARPTKSQMDREAGKPSITPDAFNGMSIGEADKLLPVLKAIQTAVERNVPAVADLTKPRN
jgi:tape measure domain-containing protein